MVTESGRAGDGRLLNRLGTLLPSAVPLDTRSWTHRHAAVLGVLWGLVAGVLIFAIVANRDGLDIIGDLAIVLVPAIVASMPTLSRQVRATFAVFGLAICCELLVGYAGSAYDVDILLLLIVVVSAFYRSWSPFLLTTSLVALHYAVYAIASVSVVAGQPDAWERWTGVWAYVGLRGLFLLGAALLGLAGWRLDELTHEDREGHRAVSAPEPAESTTVTGRLMARRRAATKHVAGLLIDTLTGLRNRTGFMQALTDACQRAHGRGRCGGAARRPGPIHGHQEQPRASDGRCVAGRSWQAPAPSGQRG